MDILGVLLVLISIFAVPTLAIFGLIAFFKKKENTKRYFGLSAGAFILFIVGAVLITESEPAIQLSDTREIEVATNELDEVTIELENWEETGSIYIGEVTQLIDAKTVTSEVIPLNIDESVIKAEKITFENVLSNEEVRKLIAVFTDRSAAEDFVKTVEKDFKNKPIAQEAYDSYLTAPKDVTQYVSYLNKTIKAETALALDTSDGKQKKKADQDANEQSEDKKQAEKKKTEEKAKKDKEKTATNKKLSGMKVHFIDVGQADAALIEYDDKAILIDSGDWNRNETVGYLEKQGIKKIDLIVGSHPHADHIGQIDKVINNFEVDEVWMSGGIATSQVFERVITAIDENNIGYDEPRAGDTFNIGNLKIDILSPSSITGNLNDDSIVMKLTYGSVSFLFTGDAETAAEKSMVSSGQNLSATILKVGHHGSDTSTTEGFLNKVNPKVAVMSVAENSKYNHPNKSVVDRINNKGIDLYATKTHGNIIITTDGSSYDISTGKSGSVTAGDTAKKETPKKQATKPKAESKPKKQATKPKAESKPKKQATKPKAESKPKKDKMPSGNCIDINKASEEALQNIIHIGPATAPKVIAARTFDNVDQLTRVSGIAEKKIADIKAEGIACVK